MLELAANDTRRVLREYPIQVPMGVGFVNKAGLVKDGTPDEFEELAGRCAVFRLDPSC